MDTVRRCPAEKFRAESVHSNEDQSPNSAEDSISLQLHLSPDSEVSKGSSVSPCPYFPSASRIQTRSASRKFSDGQDRASSGNSLASSLFGPGNRRKTLAFGELNFEGQVVKNSSEKNSSQSGQDFLKGVVALVEVYSGNENRSSCIANELESHGATISHRFTNKVTHVIFKEGKQATLEKARSKPSVHLVSVLWVEACKELKIRAAEMSFPVQISDDSLPTHLLFGSKRKRLRSMQPKSLEVETALSEERVKLRKKRAAQSRVRKAIRAYDPFSPDVLASVSRNTTSESPLIPLQNFSPEQDNNDSPEPMRSENSFEQTPEDILEGLKSLKEKIKAITENEEDDVSPPSSITPLTEVIINRLFSENGPLSGSPIPDYLKPRGNRVRPVPEQQKENRVDSDSSISLGPISVVASNRKAEKKSVGVNTSRRKKSSPKTNQRQVTRSQEKNLQDVINRVCQLGLSEENDKKKGVPRAKPTSKQRLYSSRRSLQNRLSCSPGTISAQVEKNKRKGAAKRSKEILQAQTSSSTGSQQRELVGKRKLRSSLFVVKSRCEELNNLQKGRRSSEEFVLKSKRKNLPSTPERGLAYTRLHREEQDVVNAAARHMGKFFVERNVSEKTTHIVCGDHERSLKLMEGIANGCWLLPLTWVYDSVEAETWLPEANYELKEIYPSGKARRLEKAKDLSSKLLKNFGPIYVGHGCSPVSSELNRLIRASGGKVAPSSKRASLCILPAGGKTLFNVEVPVVSEKWLLDSVTVNEVKKLEDYAL